MNLWRKWKSLPDDSRWLTIIVVGLLLAAVIFGNKQNSDDGGPRYECGRYGVDRC